MTATTALPSCGSVQRGLCHCPLAYTWTQFLCLLLDPPTARCTPAGHAKIEPQGEKLSLLKKLGMVSSWNKKWDCAASALGLFFAPSCCCSCSCC